MNFKLKKKEFYPITPALGSYLKTFGRDHGIPAIYADLTRFSESFPLFDRDGKDTLWQTVAYEPDLKKELASRLTQIYALLKTGEMGIAEHLDLARVDYCDFGNSRPFRIRIVNLFNDNYDHFYVKVADSSRIFGLELEHILSPNRINYFVNGDTLIEEHIAGLPGDAFLEDYLDKPDLSPVRLAKEFVKFNTRCFMRLLGDMRSYNYVVDITPDFEEVQYRVRAIDFDQQCYEGHREMYLPQFFPDNSPVVELVTSRLNPATRKQYRDEERTLVKRRLGVSDKRLHALIDAMRETPCSTPEKTAKLRETLNAHHQTTVFTPCETMADIVLKNLELELAKPGHVSGHPDSLDNPTSPYRPSEAL